MSTQSRYTYYTPPLFDADAVDAPTSPTWLMSIVRRMRGRLSRRRQLLDLLELDDRLLDDVGITRAQAVSAARKARFI